MSDHPHTPLDTDRACVRCSYNLRGLPMDGVCPECGTPVADSLRGYYLAFAAPEYLAAVHSGLGLVLAGILTYAAFLIPGLAWRLSGAFRGNPAPIDEVRHAALLIPTILLLLGYWRFTRPDPGLAEREAPVSVRRVIRASVVVQAVAAVAGVPAAAWGTGGPAALPGTFELVLNLLDIAAIVAWIAQFFATMAYVGWLGRRVPDRLIVDRSLSYSWVLPLVFVLGAMLAGLGPIVAAGMYWWLLNRLRRRVGSIRRTGAPTGFA